MKVFYRVYYFHCDECCVELITITSIRNKDKKFIHHFSIKCGTSLGIKLQEHQIKYFQVSN